MNESLKHELGFPSLLPTDRFALISRRLQQCPKHRSMLSCFLHSCMLACSLLFKFGCLVFFTGLSILTEVAILRRNAEMPAGQLIGQRQRVANRLVKVSVLNCLPWLRVRSNETMLPKQGLTIDNVYYQNVRLNKNCPFPIEFDQVPCHRSLRK